VTVQAVLWVVLLTLSPTLELRASIPYAILVEDWSLWQAASMGILANTALAPLVWLLGFRFRSYLMSSFLGCLLAGVLVTLLVASGSEVFHFMYKAPPTF